MLCILVVLASSNLLFNVKGANFFIVTSYSLVQEIA